MVKIILTVVQCTLNVMFYIFLNVREDILSIVQLSWWMRFDMRGEFRIERNLQRKWYRMKSTREFRLRPSFTKWYQIGSRKVNFLFHYLCIMWVCKSQFSLMFARSCSKSKVISYKRILAFWRHVFKLVDFMLIRSFCSELEFVFRHIIGTNKWMHKTEIKTAKR